MLVKSYIVCMSPRTGSQLLCDALKQTGYAGIPDDYFWHFWEDPEMTILRHYDVRDHQELLRHILRTGSTPNGVFGMKIGGGGYFAFMLDCLRHGLSSNGSKRELVSKAFPDSRFIHLIRGNKVRQAVSHWRAIVTQQWTLPKGGEPAKAPADAYDFDAIDHLVDESVLLDASWREFFKEIDAKPLTVLYEDLVNDYAHAVSQVLDHLGLPANVSDLSPTVEKQADQLSEEWVHRFRNEKQQRWSKRAW